MKLVGKNKLTKIPAPNKTKSRKEWNPARGTLGVESRTGMVGEWRHLTCPRVRDLMLFFPNAVELTQVLCVVDIVLWNSDPVFLVVWFCW